jgi:hypothetical protein
LIHWSTPDLYPTLDSFTKYYLIPFPPLLLLSILTALEDTLIMAHRLLQLTTPPTLMAIGNLLLTALAALK